MNHWWSQLGCLTWLHYISYNKQPWPLMFGWIYPQSTFSLTNTLKHFDTFLWISLITQYWGFVYMFWDSSRFLVFYVLYLFSLWNFLKKKIGKISRKVQHQRTITIFKPQVGNTQPHHELTNMVRWGIETQWKSVCYPPTIHPSWCVDSSRRTRGQNVGLCDP